MEISQIIHESIVALDNWLDSIRGPDGYGGPVAHWWRDSLAYTGTGLDWRYEGIISGYLNLYRRTGDDTWLAKARRAGDDLAEGQLPEGVYRHSGFEINPQHGGTPHEAACDLALLRLAQALRERDDPAWLAYAATAERNLELFVLGMLWDGAARRLHNTIYDDSFVPNKAATTVEALLAWGEVTGDVSRIRIIVVPILEGILAAQVTDPASLIHGAIAQGVGPDGNNRRYFPFYIARCIPALIEGHRLSGDARYLAAAKAAMAFILRVRLPDGSFPQVVYRDGRANYYPQWVAGAGDILRAMDLLSTFGMDIDAVPTLNWLLEGRRGSLSLRTAYGFDSLVSQTRPSPLPDFRDLLGVCGWVDKAFHYLSGRPEAATVVAKSEGIGRSAMPCRFRGRPAIFREDGACVTIRQGRTTLYRWQKGRDWAEIV